MGPHATSDNARPLTAGAGAEAFMIALCSVRRSAAVASTSTWRGCTTSSSSARTGGPSTDASGGRLRPKRPSGEKDGAESGGGSVSYARATRRCASSRCRLVAGSVPSGSGLAGAATPGGLAQTTPADDTGAETRDDGACTWDATAPAAFVLTACSRALDSRAHTGQVAASCVGARWSDSAARGELVPTGSSDASPTGFTNT